jgi:tetratricopeptide (TPR) repeat protein
MPIRIKCPKCQTILGVKESLAGKKANCPKCRYMLTIPAPTGAPAAPPPPPPKPEDAEAMALSTFAEEAPKVAAPVQFVEFECPFCAETVKISAEHAGKQAPCPNPECKRIIKVPLLKADKPKDWRQMDKRGPSMALRQGENEPEGAWSTAQKSRVSQEALLEADAIPVRREPMTTAAKIRLGVIAGMAFCILLGGAVAGLAWWNNNRLMGPFNAAVAATGPESKLPTAGKAALQRGIGEFFLLREDTDKAKEHFQNAYSVFPMPDNKLDAERDVVLIGLMNVLLDSSADVEAGNKLSWGTVKQELGRALQRISSEESRQSALREVATRLIAAKQDELALRLVEETVPQAPAPAAPPPQDPVDQGEDAPKIAPQPSAPKRPGALLAAQQVAVLYAVGQKDKAIAIADPNTSEDNQVARQGWAEAKARKGEFAEARKIAKTGDNDLHHFEASLAVALLAGSQGKTAEAKTNLDDALKALARLKQAQPKNKGHVVPVWLMIELARACAHSDMAKEAKEVIDAMGDDEKAARSVAQLELLQVQLEAKKTQDVPPSLVNEIMTSKDTAAYWLAMERVARHNTRLGKRSEALAMIDGGDGSSQPFVQLGVALGMMDLRK